MRKSNKKNLSNIKPNRWGVFSNSTREEAYLIRLAF